MSTGGSNLVSAKDWVPGVNHLKQHGRWAFAEFTEVYQIEHDFKEKVESEFNQMIESYVPVEA